MPRILTDWEAFMATSDLNAYVDLEGCDCEGTCQCGQEDDVPDGTIN